MTGYLKGSKQSGSTEIYYMTMEPGLELQYIVFTRNNLSASLFTMMLRYLCKFWSGSRNHGWVRPCCRYSSGQRRLYGHCYSPSPMRRHYIRPVEDIELFQEMLVLREESCPPERSPPLARREEIVIKKSFTVPCLDIRWSVSTNIYFLITPGLCKCAKFIFIW